MKIKNLLAVLAILVGNSFVAFADVPKGMLIRNEKVAPREKIEFQIFEDSEASIGWPKDFLVELEVYLGEYPNGIWGVSKVFSIEDLGVSVGNIFSFNAPKELNRYRLTMKNGVGDRFAEGVFEVLNFLPNLRFGGKACDDLGGHWANDLINGLLKDGEYPLNDKGNCRPDTEIARERLIAWLMIVFYPGVSTAGLNNPYVDLDSDFGPYVLLATEEGIVNGRGGCAVLKLKWCEFGTGSVVNRAEILKMAIEAIGVDFSLEELRKEFPEKDPVKMFVDVENDKEWFYPYLYFATAHGVIEGVKLADGSVKAAMNEGLTFSQAAKIINLLGHTPNHGSAQ